MRCAIASGGCGSLARKERKTSCGTSFSPSRCACEMGLTVPLLTLNAASFTEVLPLLTVMTVQDRLECFVLHTLLPSEPSQAMRDAMSEVVKAQSQPLSA